MVDIHEYSDRFELYVDLAGVDPSTVELTFDGGILTLSGERREPNRKGNDEAQGRRVERGHGQFHRRFVLPDTVDSEKVNATGNHGVLTVTRDTSSSSDTGANSFACSPRPAGPCQGPKVMSRSDFGHFH